MNIPPLRLKKDQDRRLRAGHLWVYSNEVDTDKTPFDPFEPGQVVAVENAQGKWQGLAYVNPNSLICARLLTRQRGVAFDGSLFVHRIKVALSLRERLYPAPYYRLLFGEGDALPGVVVDRYGDHLVVQITTAGMEAQREALIAAFRAWAEQNEVGGYPAELMAFHLGRALDHVQPREPAYTDPPYLGVQETHHVTRRRLLSIAGQPVDPGCAGPAGAPAEEA